MGFIRDAMGATNDFHADPAQLAQTGYGGSITQGLTGQAGARKQQMDFVSMLRQRAMGQGGPSPAEMMLRRAADQSGAQGAGLAASARGVNPALAARMGVDAMSSAQQNAAGQAGVMRAQEQLAATGQLGGALQGMRGQDLSLFQGAGGLQNQQNAVNVQNTLGTNQINAGVAAQNSQTAGAIGGGILSAVAGGVTKGVTGGMAYGGQVQACMSCGGPVQLTGGGQVPGHAQVAGDSPTNDTVPAMLSPGEVVLPRTVADDPDRAAAFVRAIRRRPQGYARAMAARHATVEMDKERQ